ncbi:WPP domain-interacting protein 1 [Sesamum indicum]|uniref:WPP domain-interacting protein 1 n=1 Tax=Sesamum indicum TaxID=4182 RepID=A0A6I9U4W7_SESIN|nr:WPP domain-interacting protein 1 [Sesamum indicum]XP_011095648.1 WPP domain-interacting protein 1 [Sesamum indicum]
MDLESECSVLGSVEDNEEITNDSVSGNLENFGESKVQINGSCSVENNDNNELFPEVEQKEADVLDSVSLPPVDLKPEVSPSPSTTRKGYGLKKWRRIKRDANKGGDSSIATSKMVTQDSLYPGLNSSKRVQVYAERKQKSDGSVSSTNALVRSLDGFAQLDDSGLELGPPFAAGTDSENSEDQSSKSSTAASAPRMKYENPVVAGFLRDKGRMRSLSGKNLTHSVQRGQQGKGRIESTKKARGERVKIEKENSHSSLESDSRSSNFVFMQGTYFTNNGTQNERPKDYDGENGDEVQDSEQDNDGRQDVYDRDGEDGCEESSPEDVVADSSSEVKEERSENHGSSRDQDPLIESIFVLQSTQEALEKELVKIKEIIKDISVDDSVSDSHKEFIDVEQKLQETISDRRVPQDCSPALQSDVVETANRAVETELEGHFKQKIEVEVEYLALSSMVQKLKAAAGNHITVLEEQKALVSEQTEILDKLGNAENKALMLKKQAETLENFCEDIASADETLELQKRVCKYSSCFFLQLVLLVIILSVLFQLSPNYVEVVPT